MKKLPPIEKIYEAYSAIADIRITIEASHAVVLSSDRSKQYTVTWNENTYTSDDSATYWQGYAGYPVIAVLMLQGRLPLNRNIALLFGGVNWTDLNTKYKRNYAKAVLEVLDGIDTGANGKEQIQAEVQTVYEAIQLLEIEVKRGAPRRSK